MHKNVCTIYSNIFFVPLKLQISSCKTISVSYNMTHFQAVMSVTRPHSDVFLVIWIEKVLQGSISQTVEPYLKSMDLKSIQKLQRTIKTCCLRLVLLSLLLLFFWDGNLLLFCPLSSFLLWDWYSDIRVNSNCAPYTFCNLPWVHVLWSLLICYHASTD